MTRSLAILVVHNELPLADLNSGSLRLRRVVELLVAQGHRVTFVGLAGINQERCAEELRALGVEVHPVDARRLRGRGYSVAGAGIDLPALLRRGRFDVAWLSVYTIAEQYMAEIREHSPGTRVVVDTMDVCSVRERRGAELAGDSAALAAADRTREREAAVYSRADALVAVSSEDCAALAELAPGVPSHVVSNIHADADQGPDFDRRHGLVFVGHFAHAPNVDAVTDFHAKAWPAVRAAVPDATLTLVGPQPPAEVLALAGGGVTVTGWVPDVAPYLDAARVSIAPLRFGAGVKGKIGEALSHGLPVVTTPIGAEGMGLVGGEHGLVETEPDAFAAAVVRLLSDRSLWRRLSAAGRDHVAATLGQAAADVALRRVLEAVVPQCYVAQGVWADEAALRSALGAYANRFAPHDAVTLLVPVEPGGPPLAEAFARAERALRAAGADPASVADIAIVQCAARPALPTGALPLQDSSQPEAKGPVASIVICAYGKRDVTERCLLSLDRALGQRLGDDIELVLVDNASPDDTLELFERWADRATVVALASNQNFAGGNNAGAHVARGRVLVFLNNDTEVRPGAIEALVDEAQRPDVGVVGARLLYPDGRIQHAGFAWRSGSGNGATPFHLFEYEDGELPAARARLDLGFVTGACVSIARHVFDAIGGWDESYVNGWEDADLCLRVRAAGGRVRYLGDAAVVHHQGTTSDGRYNGHGNLERFVERWGDAIELDDAWLHGTLGTTISPLGDAAAPPDTRDGASVCVVGPTSGIGSAAAEARGLLRALRGAGARVAARTTAPTWVGPTLSRAEQSALVDAHTLPARPDSVMLHVGDAGEPLDVPRGPRVVRLADAPLARGDGAIAWTATSRLADELVAAGWPPDRVAYVPPIGVEAPIGAGGEGVLVLLPDHAQALLHTLLDALAASALRLRLVPTARTRELGHVVAARLPAAELLDPVTDERALAELAAEADVVVAADPADRFDRGALIAAAAGAAVVVRADGPAAEVLGGLAATADPDDPKALASAVAAAAASRVAREERRAAVLRACGPDAARAALARLQRIASHTPPQVPHIPYSERNAVSTRVDVPTRADALAALERGEVSEAHELLRLVVATTSDLESLNDLAVIAHTMGRNEEAERLLGAVLAIDPDREDARDNLAALRVMTPEAPWRHSATLGGDDPSLPERAFPGMPAPDVMSEHSSRYAFALGLVGGCDVLDLGCGTGYGAEMLTWTARSVRGFDLWVPGDDERPSWPGAPRLHYGHDLCTDPLPAADAAVAFEVIEHLPDAPAALRIAWQAVGMVIASFPNPAYHGSWLNPYHVNDWSLERFEREVTEAAAACGRQVQVAHYHQPLKSPLMTPGRDPAASYWVLVARA